MKSKFSPVAGVVAFTLISIFTVQFASRGQGCAAAPPGLVSWWRAENNALDSVSATSGALMNGASFSAGEVGQAFSFNGAGQYVKIPKAPNQDAGSQVTIEFWMRADPTNAMNSYQGLVTSDFYGIEIANGFYPGPLGVEFFISTDGGASVSPSSYPDTATVNGGGAVVSAGVWHHVAGTYDGTKLQLYIDGQPWGVPNYHTGAISPMLANSFVSIGSEDGRTICPFCVSSRYFNGEIDEPAIYNRALSASEIQAIYNAGSAGKCADSTNAFLLNVDFQGTNLTFSSKVGFAAIGHMANDYWNYYTRDDGFGGWRTFGFITNLALADGTPTTIGMTVDNAPGAWGGASSDPMYKFYIYPLNGGNATITITNLPPGRYDVLPYSADGNLELTVGGVSYGIKHTYDSPFIDVPPWTEGKQYARFSNVQVTAGQLLVLTVRTGNDGYAIISGMQIAASSQTQTCVSTPSGLAAWWPAEGNASDIIGGDNGTLQGGATFASGKVGQGFRFDGTNGYVQIPDSDALKPTNVTCEAWVWLDPNVPANRGGEQIIFKKNTWSAWFEGYSLLKITIDNGDGTYSDRFQFCVSRFGNQVIINSQTIAQRGVWYHVAATYDGNQSKLFVNGVAEASATPGFALDYDTTPIFIGTSGTWAPYLSMFAGIIDEAAIYNRALATNEIAAIYNAGSAGKCSPFVMTNNCVTPPADMVSWWRGEGTAADAVGGNDATLLNGVAFAPGEVGQAFVFNGTNSYLEAADSPALRLTNELTIEFWVKRLRFDESVEYCVEKGGDWTWGQQDYGVTLNRGSVNNCLSFHFAGGWRGGGSVADANWHHCAVVARNGDVNPTFYIDGVLQPVVYNEGASVINLYPSTRPLHLGAQVDPVSGWNYFADVILDEVAIYKRALSAAEIQSIYHAGSAGKCEPNGPQISTIADQQIDYNTSTGPLAFTVSEVGTPVTSLVVTASSSNTNLMPNEQIVLGGTDTNRTVTLTPNSNQIGVAVITLIVTDPGGATNQSSFALNVVNNPPVISSLASQHVPLGTNVGPLAFTVSDVETPADQLVVTASSSNTNFVDNGHIILGGAGTNRTVTITPNSNQVGVATITLTVTDAGALSNHTSFTLTVDQFTQIAPGLPELTYSAAAWGDYDNDGKLDLLVSGTTNGLASGAITRIYHNDGGVFTNFISLTNIFHSAVSWADYDRDGYLDVLVSGINNSNIPAARLYHNNGNGTFTDVNAGLAGCYSGTMAWGDFNNDGAPDIFLSGLVPLPSAGTAQLTTNIAKLYRNDGNGVFTDVNVNLPLVDNRIAGPSLGTAAWGDYDNDGRLDLLLVGSINNIVGIASVYRNLGNGVFTNVFNSGVASYFGGSGAWGDYDNDGSLDIAISGALGSTAIYHNNGNGTFTLKTTLSGGTTPSVAWGDFNNDGYPDLLVGTGTSSHLYRNTGTGTFTDTQSTLPSISNGSLAVGDYNNDGNLDIFFVWSQQEFLLRNNSGVSNTPPAAPFDLVSATALTNSVVLRWQAPVDLQTKSNGLNYNLRVGTTPGGVDVVSPLADPITGLRRVAAMGNAGPTNRALLINLPKGTYYWSVQAIDTAFAGSPFFQLPGGIDRTFTITNALPTISNIPDEFIAPGTNAPGPILPFLIGDLETKASNLVVTARSSNTNVVALTNIVFGGSGSNRTVRVAARTNGTSVITVTVTDAQGAFASDNFTVTAEQFSFVSSNFVQVQNSLIAWGDYNNDGRLDVLIAGATNGSTGIYFPPASAPVTQLYRNDGNGVFTPVASGLPNVTRGSAAWGDFNNDGLLDLILTGTTNNTSSGAISRIYRNNGDGTFTDIGAGLPGVYGSAVVWGDFDNDGRLDLLLTGTTNSSSSGAITRIYHNNGDGTFSNAVTLTGVYQSAVACADFDGDGDLDLVISGMNPVSAPVSLVYRNNGNGSFTQAASLIGVYSSSVAVGDFDNDGRPDILLAGSTTSTAFSGVFRNSGNFVFSNIGAGLPATRLPSVAWGDFDNDGRLDILISGTTSFSIPPTAGAFTRVYRNTGSPLQTAFTNFPVNLPTNYSGTVTWADFDNDGKLDILLAGTDGVLVEHLQTPRSQTMLFRNNNNVSNTPPTAPTSLAMTRSNNIVSLTWAKSTDLQTRTILAGAPITNYDGLKYQVRVGTSPSGIEIESPLSDPGTGYRRVVRGGDASTNRWIFTNLPPGNYFWSVQAIDTAFAGSPFATEAAFTVSHPPVANPDAITTASNTPAVFAAAKLALNDTDPDGDALTVIAVSASSAQGGTVTLVSGQVTYSPPANFTGNDSFLYTITDGQGDTAVGTVMATVGSGGTVALNIVFGPAIIGGNFIVSFAGVPGLTYTIEATSNLAGPWTKVANLIAPVTDQGSGIGVFSFTEPVNGNSTRFYRTIYPAY